MQNTLIGDIKKQLRHCNWQADNALVQASLPNALAPWLCNKGSLTSALMSIAQGTFKVDVLSQTITRPLWHEQQILGSADGLAAMVREVNLHIQGEPVVHARSIIPLSLAKRGGGGLATLGTMPLGHLLFKDGRMRVSRRQFTELNFAQASVYARRTPYDYLGKSILVTECFLPGLTRHSSGRLS